MTYTKKDLTDIALALYGARKSLPTAGAGYQAWVTKNARVLVLADLTAAIERTRSYLESGKDRIAERRAELERAGSPYHRDEAQRRLDWHLKEQKKDQAKLNHYISLHEKIRLGGMPSADAFDVLEPALRGVLS